MKIEIDISDSKYRIDAYEKGAITVNGERYTSSIIITPERLIPGWPPRRHADLASQHIEQIAVLEPEIIILGTGRILAFPPPGIFTAIEALNIGYEVMDTGAACRCYNLLAGEGRRVAAGLIVIAD